MLNVDLRCVTRRSGQFKISDVSNQSSAFTYRGWQVLENSGYGKLHATQTIILQTLISIYSSFDKDIDISNYLISNIRADLQVTYDSYIGAGTWTRDSWKMKSSRSLKNCFPQGVLDCGPRRGMNAASSTKGVTENTTQNATTVTEQLAK
jgi:hypothetical protein